MTTVFSAHPGAHAAPLPERWAAARRALRRTFRLRARLASGDASPDGPPLSPAIGAARYPRGGALLGQPRHRPGSAGLPAQGVAMLADRWDKVAAPDPETREAAS